MVLGGVGIARPEENGEGGQDDGYDQIHIADGQRHGIGVLGRVAEKNGDGLRNSLELKGDIGKDARDRDDCHNRRHGRVLAIPRRDEIRDRGDVLSFRQHYDAPQQWRGERERDNRPKIDRDEVEALRRG